MFSIKKMIISVKNLTFFSFSLFTFLNSVQNGLKSIDQKTETLYNKKHWRFSWFIYLSEALHSLSGAVLLYKGGSHVRTYAGEANSTHL